MSLFSLILTRQISTLNPKDVFGIKRICFDCFADSKLTSVSLPNTCEIIDSSAFSYNESLKSLTLPPSITRLGPSAFYGCTALTNVNLNVSPNCVIEASCFAQAPFYTNATSNLYAANGKILLKDISPTWPSGIINLAADVGANLFGSATTIVIPENIQIIGGRIVAANATKMTIGSNCKYLGISSIPTSVTTLICKQPAGMNVRTPASGETSGLTYEKDARSMTIYTDNEDMKNYDWAGDNVTPTFYPLSQAPV